MKKLIALLTLVFFFLYGCEKEEADQKPTGPIRDSTAAAAKVNAANTALEEVLYTLINGPEPQDPMDLNFTVPYNLYREALQLDTLNPTAHFGVGLLEILMLSRENSMQQIFDDWKNFIERDSIFEINLPGLFTREPPLSRPVFSGTELALPFMSPLTILKTLTDGNRVMTVNPSIRDAQDFLLSHLVPRLSSAIDHLQFVANQPSFTFVVTARMQGDPWEDEVYLDLTEINATLSALNVLKAQVLHWCAYDLSFEDYTGNGLRNAVTQSSPFLALRSQGAQHMATAGDCWLNAIDALDRAITHLEAETGNQSRHLIKIDPNDGITRQDLDTLKAYLPKIRRAFTTSERFMMDADGNDSTPEVNLEISMRQMFHNAVQNLKGLLPPYTVSLDTGVVYAEENRYENLSQVVHFPFAGNHYWEHVAEMEYGTITQEFLNYSYNFPELDTIWNRKVAEYRQRNYPFARLRLWLYPNYQQQGNWYNGINFEVFYREIWRTRWQPVITWQAQNFQEWILPNPTINGLLPGMTDATFKQTFGIRAEDWQRTMVMRLWN
ncbi:MAG: hypothetical protein N2450_07760 [bacterium]|nr:hypothetical protein [bacterium]